MSLPLSTTLHLARTRTPADRSRVRLATAALAFSGALVINAARISRMGPDHLDANAYSNYVAEPGLRSGLAATLVVLALLSGGLAIQALRIGTAARERRMTALRWAGASESQVRRLSAVDAGLVGLVGGVLSGPLYVVLVLLFGLLPRMARVFPDLGVFDPLTWLVVTGAVTLGGVAVGHLLHQDLPSSTKRPLGAPQRVGAAVGVFLLVAGLAISANVISLLAAAATVVGLGAICWSGLPSLNRAIGRRLTRSASPVNLLTGARLGADARAAARLGALLFGCGFLIGVLASSALGVIVDKPLWSDREFYLTGFGLAVFGVLLIVVIAQAAFVVGVADQLVDQRRQLASLTALGVNTGLLRAVIRRQLLVTAAPALCVGLISGVFTGTDRLVGNRYADANGIGSVLLAGLMLLILGWATAAAGAALAGFLLRNQLRDALDPENLRAA